MFFLQLNMMRNAYNSLSVVAYADSEQELLNLLESELVPTYQEAFQEFFGEHIYSKTYRKGGPLEWFNKPYESSGILMAGHNEPAIVNYGTREEFQVRAGEQWDMLRQRFPHVSNLNTLPTNKIKETEL